MLSHLPPHLELIEKVLDRGALKGVQKAIKVKNLEWTPTTNATRYGFLTLLGPRVAVLSLKIALSTTF